MREFNHDPSEEYRNMRTSIKVIAGVAAGLALLTCIKSCTEDDNTTVKYSAKCEGQTEYVVPAGTGHNAMLSKIEGVSKFNATRQSDQSGAEINSYSEAADRDKAFRSDVISKIEAMNPGNDLTTLEAGEHIKIPIACNLVQIKSNNG